jgi:homopolymeric O-antigen transport system permease protein
MTRLMKTSTAAATVHADYFPASVEPGGFARLLRTVRDDAREITRFWPVVWNLVSQDLRVKYQRSVLGFLWTLLNPVLMMGTMALVFSQVLGVKRPSDYAIYLFAGMVPWGLLYQVISESAICIIYNEALIRKIYVPKLVFPLARVVLNSVMVGLSMSALFVLMVPLGAPITFGLFALPLIMLLFAAFCLGLGLLVATINTFYRDFGHLVAVVLQAWYFATPIVYFADLVPAEVRWRFWLNPAYPFIRMFQVVIHDGRWPDLVLISTSAGVAAVTLGVGYAVFKAYEDKLVFRL